MGDSMVKIVVVVASLLMLLVSTASASQVGDYAGLSSGLFTPKSTLTDRNGSSANLSNDSVGIPVGLYAGRQFENGLRAEGELFYRSVTNNEIRYLNTTSKINSNLWSIGAMGNVYYNLYNDAKAFTGALFSPYVGLGIGFANIDMSSATTNRFKLWNSGHDLVFAYQAILGYDIPIKKDFILDVSYRYCSTTNINIDQINTNFNTHNILLGVRYYFK